MDFAQLLEPLSEESPTGDNLRYVDGDSTFESIEDNRSEEDPALAIEGEGKTANWKAAYGALLEGGIHFVALVADLADVSLAGRAEPAPVRAPTTVTAQFPTVSGGDAERHSGVILTYEGGLEARLHYGWDVPSLTKGTFQHSRVAGDTGRILFESNGIYLHVRGPGRRGLTFPGFGDLMGYGAMTDDFLRCVVSGETTPYSNLNRARRDLDIVFRAYRHLPDDA